MNTLEFTSSQSWMQMLCPILKKPTLSRKHRSKRFHRPFGGKKSISPHTTQQKNKNPWQTFFFPSSPLQPCPRQLLKLPNSPPYRYLCGLHSFPGAFESIHPAEAIFPTGKILPQRKIRILYSLLVPLTPSITSKRTQAIKK